MPKACTTNADCDGVCVNSVCMEMREGGCISGLKFGGIAIVLIIVVLFVLSHYKAKKAALPKDRK